MPKQLGMLTAASCLSLPGARKEGSCYGLGSCEVGL